MGCGTTNDMYFDKLFMGRRKTNECMLFTFRDQMPWQIRFQKNALIYSGYDKHNGGQSLKYSWMICFLRKQE